MTRIQTDLFVVGGGPAGLAAGIAARLQGLNVVVADASRPPIDKACGEGLMPDALSALEQLGIFIDPSECFAFDGIRFLGNSRSAEASFPGKSGFGVRRTRLHESLIARAEQTGVKLLWGTHVTGISDGQVRLHDGEVTCRWIAGADGENSRVRKWAGLDAIRSETLRYGFRRHYSLAPWTSRMEIYWGAGCQMYVTPVNPSEVCVVVLSRDSHARFEAALPQFPALHARLAGVPVTSRERGAISASRSLRRVCGKNVFLLGDASGSVDAVSGEGICLSLHQAIALAGSLASGNPHRYQAAHRRLARRPRTMAGLLLSLDRFPKLRAKVIDAMAARPEIFERMLAMHVGSESIPGFLLDALLPLGWELLTA